MTHLNLKLSKNTFHNINNHLELFLTKISSAKKQENFYIFFGSLFVADNIVFEVSKIGPVDPDIWLKKWSK